MYIIFYVYEHKYISLFTNQQGSGLPIIIIIIIITHRAWVAAWSMSTTTQPRLKSRNSLKVVSGA